MQAWLMAFMSSYGYLAVASLIAIETIFPPIPSEVILCFGGFMTTMSSMEVIGVILCATIGSVVGAILLYGIGRLLPKERLENILDGRVTQVLRLKREHIEKAQQWFDKRGYWTVFFCRFIPIIRSLISIPAGMAKMKLTHFLILTTIGSGIWNAVLIYLGKAAGASWENIANSISSYANIIMSLFVIIIILGFIFLLLRRKKA